MNSAWALGDDESVTNAVVRSPETGTVCMAGTSAGGVGLELQLAEGDAPFTLLAANAPLLLTAAQFFHAGALGITGLSFTIETPPSTGVAPSILTFAECASAPTTYSGEQDGNPVVITTGGMTTTLAFSDFVAQSTLPFDANGISQLNFTVGSGPYDFCISNLKFLDANGDEVTQ